MDRFYIFAVFIIPWFTPFLVGFEQPKDGQKEAPPSTPRSDPILRADDDAKSVIDKAVKAHGGEKSFSRWNCGHFKYKTKGGIVPAEGDEQAEPIVNKFTEKTEHPFAGFCNLAPLREKGVQATKLGVEKINDRESLGIRAKSDKLGQVDFYFDLQTALLVKSRKFIPSTDPNKTAVMEAFLGDYKDAQGTMVPMKIKGVQDGKVVLNVTLIEARFADKFEESAFAKP